MTTQEIALNIENKVNMQLNKYDLCEATGDLSGMAEAAEQIEQLMDKLNENRITLVLPKETTENYLQ